MYIYIHIYILYMYILYKYIYTYIYTYLPVSQASPDTDCCENSIICSSDPCDELKPVRSTYATAPWSGGEGTAVKPVEAAEPSTVTMLCLYIYMYVHIYVHVYICIYVCIYLYLCIYTYI
jgi:hypothetical protein